MSNKQQEQYTNQSISSLKGADRVRKRPGVIFGSDGIEGCQHSVFEILSNSIDEAREGFGDVINITLFSDHSIEIEDFGRGIPVDYNEKEQKYNWELVFCELYAGGKYREGGDNYEYALGLNGLGLCATQYASEYMDAEIRRDGYVYTLRFEAGEIVGEMRKAKVDGHQKTGTKIRWQPDLRVFTDIAISSEYLADILRRQAIVNAGLRFVLNVEGEGKQTFLYENGIVDYLTETSPDRITEIIFRETETAGRDREDKAEYKVKLSAAFCFTRGAVLSEHYHNSSFLEHGGSPEKALRGAFVSEIDALIKKLNKYQKNESKITYADVADCLCFVSNNFSTQTSYENQTKKAITNRFVQSAVTEFLRHTLEVYFIENPADAEKIADQVLVNKRSRENAEKTRQNLKKTLQQNNDIASRVQKFVDCRTKDLNRREIYIVEGDSALGACKLSRDAEFQAIIPVRGKILNCLKAEMGRILKSEIITDLIKVLGCGADIKSKDVSGFNIDKLRFSKIIICTDADYDGYQIRVLILTMIYRLMPQLIEQGYVHIAQSPLYEIVSGGKSYFAYSEREKGDILEMIGEAKYTIARSKGLGENEPDMMWLTTMSPDTRRLIKVMPTEAEDTAEMFDLFQGDNIAGRKDYITEYGGDYIDLTELN